MTASPFTLQARPAPPPRVMSYVRTWQQTHTASVRPLVTTVVQRPDTRPDSPVTSVVCDYCDTVMNIHQITPLLFQCVCDTCGTSGPRRITEAFALAATARLFKK